MLQNHPTSRSCPHKQAGTRRTPFEMGFICNNDKGLLPFIYFSSHDFAVTTVLREMEGFRGGLNG